MFLIRTAFWLTVLILLLPTNEQEQREVYGTAEAAVHDVKTFCVRNPDVCETSKSAFETFSQKAQFGAKMLMDFVANRAGEPAEPASMESDAQRSRLSIFRRDPGNTLTDDDMNVAWSAPNG